MATGKVRAIGVANYSKRYLEQLLPQASIVPAVNQIENHPSLPQQEIVNFCKEKGIHITAYSPLGSAGGPLLTSEAVVDVANKRGVSPATVLLSWHGKLLFPLCPPSLPSAIASSFSNTSTSCSRKLRPRKVRKPRPHRGKQEPCQARRLGYGNYRQIHQRTREEQVVGQIRLPTLRYRLRVPRQVVGGNPVSPPIFRSSKYSWMGLWQAWICGFPSAKAYALASFCVRG